MELELNYSHDVYSAVAAAIEGRDPEMIEAIRRKCADWMEPENEKKAREQMLNAVAEMIYELE